MRCVRDHDGQRWRKKSRETWRLAGFPPRVGGGVFGSGGLGLALARRRACDLRAIRRSSTGRDADAAIPARRRDNRFSRRSENGLRRAAYGEFLAESPLRGLRRPRSAEQAWALATRDVLNVLHELEPKGASLRVLDPGHRNRWADGPHGSDSAGHGRRD